MASAVRRDAQRAKRAVEDGLTRPDPAAERQLLLARDGVEREPGERLRERHREDEGDDETDRPEQDPEDEMVGQLAAAPDRERGRAAEEQSSDQHRDHGPAPGRRRRDDERRRRRTARARLRRTRAPPASRPEANHERDLCQPRAGGEGTMRGCDPRVSVSRSALPSPLLSLWARSLAGTPRLPRPKAARRAARRSAGPMPGLQSSPSASGSSCFRPASSPLPRIPR